MKTLTKAVIAGATGLIAMGMTAASADQKSNRAYDSGVSVRISVGDDRYDDRHRSGERRADRRYEGRRNGYRGKRSRVVNREVFQTRHRARIVLIEEVVRKRRGPRLICTVEARGPEARYVSERRMRRIARNNCSSRARIKVYA